MHRIRLAAAATVLAALAAIPMSGPTAAATTGPQPPSLPQTSAAAAGASWLAARVTPSGYVESTTSPGQADLVATANVVFALASAGTARTTALTALGYLAGHVDAYATAGGQDVPGSLALLILDAQALGADPRAFGGADLVARLQATQVASGPDAGLFGAQDPTWDGTYRQGLALAALAAVGVTTGGVVAAGVAWLAAQQCPNGGWTSYIAPANPCDGSPASYQGPDTNSTALAIQGLAAQHALGATAAASATRFLSKGQDRDGGWGYEPSAPRAPGSTDPDSTALVLQALLALHVSPSAKAIGRKGGGPVASLLASQLVSGADAGAVAFPGIPGADLLATYQAVPALAGVTIAYDLPPVAVTKVAPARGPLAGGTTVTITGTSLYAATGVSFGGTPAASLTVLSDTTVRAVSPPGTGTVDVTVITPTATSAVSSADRYTYRG